jgi:hypothetical protein
MEELWKIAAPVSAALTLLTWLGFNYASATSGSPLTPAETTFVYAVWFCVTLGVRWLWRHFRSKPAEGTQPDAHKS